MKAPKLYRIPLTEIELREIRRKISLDNAYDDPAYYSARDKLDRALSNIHKQR